MDEPFDQISWYLTEPRYHRLKFTSVTEALPDQEKLEVPSHNDEKQQPFEPAITQLLPSNEEQEFQDEDEVTQKVAIPNALKKYLQKQKTVYLSALNGNGARKELQKQETLKVAAPNSVNGVKKGLPEQATLKVTTPPDR